MSTALDRFFDHYYQRRPVTATFTGVHAYDALLPDWSIEGLSSLQSEMRELIVTLSDEHPRDASVDDLRRDIDALDAELARRFLEMQLVENNGIHGVRAGWRRIRFPVGSRPLVRTFARGSPRRRA